MLRLSSYVKDTHSSLFTIINNLQDKADVTGQNLIKDIWDFGDKLMLGERTTSTIKCWEAVSRYSIKDDNETDIYIDIFAEGTPGYGPSERQTKEINRQIIDDCIIDTDGTIVELMLPVRSPFNITTRDIIQLLTTSNLSEAKWLGFPTKTNSHKQKPAQSKIGATAIPLIIRDLPICANNGKK